MEDFGTIWPPAQEFTSDQSSDNSGTTADFIPPSVPSISPPDYETILGGKPLCPLSPWEELPYFDLPVLTHSGVTGFPAVKLVGRNPMRVAIIISGWVPPQIYNDEWFLMCSPVPALNSDSTGTGIIIGRFRPNLMLTHEQYPWLVQGEWWITSAPSNVHVCVHCTEIIMSQWGKRHAPRSRRV